MNGAPTLPTILAIETAILSGSISLFINGEAFTSALSNTSRSEALLPEIELLLTSRNIRPTDIDKIGVSIGPGSFTGIRIGMATAIGLASALSIDCLRINTVEALASQPTDVDRNIVIPLGRDNYAVRHFRLATQGQSRSLDLEVVTQKELTQRIDSNEATIFLLPNESSRDEGSHHIQRYKNVQTLPEATSALIGKMVLNGQGTLEGEPLYVKREFA